MATYYVDPSGGSDAAAGTSFGAAWLTTQKAADTAAAGDEVRLCKVATETTAAIVQFDTNAGTAASPIEFLSYNSTGTTKEDGYILQASASIANLLNFTASAAYAYFRGVDLDGNSNVSSHLINSNVSGGGSGTLFDVCILHGASGAGAHIRGVAFGFFNCDIHTNGGRGLQPASTANSRWTDGTVYGCDIHDNTSDGMGGFGAQDFLIAHNNIYDNGADGINYSAAESDGCRIINNNCHGNTSDGISMSSNAGLAVITGNTCSDNGAYGFLLGTTNAGRYMDANHTYNNTSGVTDFDSGTLPGSNNVTGDPLFTSTTDGSENYIPLTTSPLIGADLAGGNIGALAHADGGGGGGGVKLAGRGGGMVG